jgi:hypothetical protein
MPTSPRMAIAFPCKRSEGKGGCIASIHFHSFLSEIRQVLASIQVQEWPETIRVVGLRPSLIC